MVIYIFRTVAPTTATNPSSASIRAPSFVPNTLAFDCLVSLLNSTTRTRSDRWSVSSILDLPRYLKPDLYPILFCLHTQFMLPDGSRLICMIYVSQHVFPGLDLYYADPAQGLTTACEVQLIDYLHHDLLCLIYLPTRWSRSRSIWCICPTVGALHCGM